MGEIDPCRNASMSENSLQAAAKLPHVTQPVFVSVMGGKLSSKYTYT